MKPPTPIDIVWTALAEWCVWHKAVLGTSSDLNEIASDPRLERYFTLTEADFVRNHGETASRNLDLMPVSQCVEPLDQGKRFEIIWTLLWSVRIGSALTEVSRTTDQTLALFAGRSAEDIVYEAHRRPLAEIAKKLVDFRAANPADGVAQSRINALEWVMGAREWAYVFAQADNRCNV